MGTIYSDLFMRNPVTDSLSNYLDKHVYLLIIFYATIMQLFLRPSNAFPAQCLREAVPSPPLHCMLAGLDRCPCLHLIRGLGWRFCYC